MLIRRNGEHWEALAPAKLNLFLEIHGSRDDGFHELDMLMVPIALYDSLVFSLTADAEIQLTARWAMASRCMATLPAAEDNLIVRALQLLRRKIRERDSGFSQGLRVDLVKRIPSAAGLGGASSDAATALVVANELWQAGFDRHALAEMALQIGSDVPFFLTATPARCRGRGEKIDPIESGSSLHVVLVKPRVGLSTADVFSEYQRQGVSDVVEIDSALAAFGKGQAGSVGRNLHNRLVESAMKVAPTLKKLQKDLADLHLLGTQMTGSGSTFFAICHNACHAQATAKTLSARGYDSVFNTRTLSRCAFSPAWFEKIQT